MLLALLVPASTAAPAAAQVVPISAAAGAAASASGAAALAPRASSRLSLPASPLATLSAVSLSAPSAPSAAAVSAPAAALSVAAPSAAAPAAVAAPAAAVSAPAASPAAAADAAVIAPAAALAASAPAAYAAEEIANVPEAGAPAARETSSARWTGFFDGLASRRALADVPAADAVDARGFRGGPAALSAATPRSGAVNAATPIKPKMRAPSRAFGGVAVAAAIALLVLAVPSFAFAAGPTMSITAASTTSLLAGLHPAASAVGAVAGAIYGMFAARAKDGSAASSGDVFASILRYGVLGGAGVYILFDLTGLAFGSVLGINPLSTGVATAALGRTAFQDKFSDPATTSADRILGAFPAVAATFGLSVATISALAVAPALTLTAVATGAMGAVGVLSALYAALYAPGRSPADGPARMAKGFVLQALMAGLALSLSSAWLVWPFAAMSAAGFALVLWTVAREVWSLRARLQTPAKP